MSCAFCTAYDDERRLRAARRERVGPGPERPGARNPISTLLYFLTLQRVRRFIIASFIRHLPLLVFPSPFDTRGGGFTLRR